MLHVSPPVVPSQTPSAPTFARDLTASVSAPGAPLQDILNDPESPSSENQTTVFMLA